MEGEEEEPVERPVILNECGTELKSDHGRPERIQDLNTHTPVALPTTAETSPESRDTPTSKPTELVGCFEFNGPLRQYFSLYRAVSQREGERGEKG